MQDSADARRPDRFRLVTARVGADDPAGFHTGLVAELSALLRGSVPDPAIDERSIRTNGEPALELGCGDGDPMLELRRLGRRVERTREAATDP